MLPMSMSMSMSTIRSRMRLRRFMWVIPKRRGKRGECRIEMRGRTSSGTGTGSGVWRSGVIIVTGCGGIRIMKTGRMS